MNHFKIYCKTQIILIGLCLQNDTDLYYCVYDHTWLASCVGVLLLSECVIWAIIERAPGVIESASHRIPLNRRSLKYILKTIMLSWTRNCILVHLSCNAKCTTIQRLQTFTDFQQVVLLCMWSYMACQLRGCAIVK